MPKLAATVLIVEDSSNADVAVLRDACLCSSAIGEPSSRPKTKTLFSNDDLSVHEIDFASSEAPIPSRHVCVVLEAKDGKAGSAALVCKTLLLKEVCGEGPFDLFHLNVILAQQADDEATQVDSLNCLLEPFAATEAATFFPTLSVWVGACVNQFTTNPISVGDEKGEVVGPRSSAITSAVNALFSDKRPLTHLFATIMCITTNVPTKVDPCFRRPLCVLADAFRLRHEFTTACYDHLSNSTSTPESLVESAPKGRNLQRYEYLFFAALVGPALPFRYFLSMACGNAPVSELFAGLHAIECDAPKQSSSDAPAPPSEGVDGSALPEGAKGCLSFQFGDLPLHEVAASILSATTAKKSKFKEGVEAITEWVASCEAFQRENKHHTVCLLTGKKNARLKKGVHWHARSNPSQTFTTIAATTPLPSEADVSAPTTTIIAVYEEGNPHLDFNDCQGKLLTPLEIDLDGMVAWFNSRNPNMKHLMAAAKKLLSNLNPQPNSTRLIQAICNFTSDIANKDDDKHAVLCFKGMLRNELGSISPSGIKALLPKSMAELESWLNEDVEVDDGLAEEELQDGRLDELGAFGKRIESMTCETFTRLSERKLFLSAANAIPLRAGGVFVGTSPVVDVQPPSLREVKIWAAGVEYGIKLAQSKSKEGTKSQPNDLPTQPASSTKDPVTVAAVVHAETTRSSPPPEGPPKALSSNAQPFQFNPAAAQPFVPGGAKSSLTSPPSSVSSRSGGLSANASEFRPPSSVPAPAHMGGPQYAPPHQYQQHYPAYQHNPAYAPSYSFHEPQQLQQAAPASEPFKLNPETVMAERRGPFLHTQLRHACGFLHKLKDPDTEDKTVYKLHVSESCAKECCSDEKIYNFPHLLGLHFNVVSCEQCTKETSPLNSASVVTGYANTVLMGENKCGGGEPSQPFIHAETLFLFGLAAAASKDVNSRLAPITPAEGMSLLPLVTIAAARSHAQMGRFAKARRGNRSDKVIDIPLVERALNESLSTHMGDCLSLTNILHHAIDKEVPEGVWEDVTLRPDYLLTGACSSYLQSLCFRLSRLFFDRNANNGSGGFNSACECALNYCHPIFVSDDQNSHFRFEPTDNFYCEVCGIHIGESGLKKHFEGRKHTQHLNEFKLPLAMGEAAHEAIEAEKVTEPHNRKSMVELLLERCGKDPASFSHAFLHEAEKKWSPEASGAAANSGNNNYNSTVSGLNNSPPNTNVTANHNYVSPPPTTVGASSRRVLETAAPPADTRETLQSRRRVEDQPPTHSSTGGTGDDGFDIDINRTLDGLIGE